MENMIIIIARFTLYGSFINLVLNIQITTQQVGSPEPSS